MSFDATVIQRVAKLAHIRLEPEEQEKLAKNMADILSWVDHLSEVDVTGVSPMRDMSGEYAPLRQDKVTDGDCLEKVLGSAPERHGPYFTVPKVVE